MTEPTSGPVKPEDRTLRVQEWTEGHDAALEIARSYSFSSVPYSPLNILRHLLEKLQAGESVTLDDVRTLNQSEGNPWHNDDTLVAMWTWICAFLDQIREAVERYRANPAAGSTAEAEAIRKLLSSLPDIALRDAAISADAIVAAARTIADTPPAHTAE